LNIDMMIFNKWQRFLFLSADGVINNCGNYPHSMQMWIDKIFNFITKPLEDMSKKEEMDFTIKYRNLRSRYISNKSQGQGKGTEKGKIITSVDGKLYFSTPPNKNTGISHNFEPPINFIKALGNELNL